MPDGQQRLLSTATDVTIYIVTNVIVAVVCVVTTVVVAAAVDGLPFWYPG